MGYIYIYLQVYVFTLGSDPTPSREIKVHGDPLTEKI